MKVLTPREDGTDMFDVLVTFSIMALVTGVSGVYRICPTSIGLRKAQAMAPPVVLTMSRYMFIQKGAKQEKTRAEPGKPYSQGGNLMFENI